MNRPRYQDFLDELSSGDRYGIFIDDTGSPGLDTAHLGLHAERASWVAVVVPPIYMREVLEQFPPTLHELYRIVRAKEFHFGDIYAGRKEFRRVSIAIRLALFEFMATIFQSYRFPIIVQTFDPESLRDIQRTRPFPDQVGPFKLGRPVDAALFFLLLRIKWYLEKQKSDPKLARVFVDEGYAKNGKILCLPTFDKVFADGFVCFARSSSVYPIQFADFAAFCLNRTQLLRGKNELSDLDKNLLTILSPIAWNYINMEKHMASLQDWTKQTKIV